MKNFVEKQGGKIILILLLIKAMFLFYDKEIKLPENINETSKISDENIKKELKYKVAMEGAKPSQKMLKKENGWVREYGKSSGELTVETFFENGIIKVRRDYSFNKKKRELYFDDENMENYREVLYYFKSGNLMSDITYKDRKIVKGKCFDNNGREYALDKKKIGNRAFGPVSVPMVDELTKKELNTATYNDADSGNIYTLCQ